jgi:hypothetical protein
MAIRWPDKSVAVTLAGPGGKLAEGLKIGNTIRVHSYTTVAAGECASACSLIWLAGTARYVLAAGSLGFHAAYVLDGASVHENVQANALIGAYLANLGLSYDVVAYVTATASTEITWLDAAEAKRLNIKYTFIQNEPPSAPPQSAPTIAAPVATAHSPAPAVYADAAKNAELNDRLYASESLLRKEVGDKKVDAATAYFRAAAAKDPSLFPKLYAQPDPYRWALRQMEESQRPSIVSSSNDTAQAAAAMRFPLVGISGAAPRSFRSCRSASLSAPRRVKG